MYMNEQLLNNSAGYLSSNRTYSVRAVKRTVSYKKLARFFGLLTVALIIIIISLCVSLFGGADQDVYAAAGGIHVQQSVEVVKGDTLWNIAGQHVHKGQDIRDYMNEVKKVNGLKTNILREGQLLQLP